MRKKLLSAIASGAMLALAVPAMSLAVGNPTVTYVSGTITHNGNPVSGANVTVTCNSNIINDISKPSGGYIAKYSPASLCPDGTTATVSATTGSLSGSNSGKVNKLTTKLNVDVVNVSIVPEMGVVAAATAATIGTGAFLVMRNRKVNN